MSKGPGKSSSNKIINYDEHEVSQGKQNERTAYPKNKLEFTFFRALGEMSLSHASPQVTPRVRGWKRLTFQTSGS